jgi:sugar phosphate isomerase/epimerase
MHFASVVEPRHLVCALGSADESLDSSLEIAADYRRACQDAAALGLLLLIEAMPWSKASRIAQAAAIATLAGQPNSGLVLDTWHFNRVDGVTTISKPSRLR